jgi:hypothetical protein
MRITHGSYTQTGRYVKESGKVLSLGGKVKIGAYDTQIVVFIDRDGLEQKVNILSPHVYNVKFTGK